MSKTSDKLEDLKRVSEPRSKRVQILIPPQLHDKMKEISAETGASVNEIINKALEAYLSDL